MTGSNLEPPSSSRRTVGAMAGFLLVGMALFSVELFFRPLYTESRRQELLSSLLEPGVLRAEDQQVLEEFLQSGGVSFAGRGLYPRFYRAKSGEPDPGGPWNPRPYPRLAFYLAGPVRRLMTMPVEKKTPYFPNASDVLVFGCPDGELLAVAVFDSTGKPSGFQMRFPLPDLPTCPLPSQEGT